LTQVETFVEFMVRKQQRRSRSKRQHPRTQPSPKRGLKKFRALVDEGKSIFAQRQIAKVVGAVEAQKLMYKIQFG